MRTFGDYFKCRLIENWSVNEAFDRAEIMAYRPENAVWDPDLDGDSSYYNYYFSLPSDPDKTVNKSGYQRPPYVLEINNYSGEASIGFKHLGTSYQDRHDKNQELAKASGGNPGQEMMMSVLHGISEFVLTKKPVQLSWSPVVKSRTGANNPQAREKVYRLWAIKNIMGDYVPVDDNRWVRADAYWAAAMAAASVASIMSIRRCFIADSEMFSE